MFQICWNWFEWIKFHCRYTYRHRRQKKNGNLYETFKSTKNNSQVLILDVESFTKKYDCMDLVTSEYRNRAASDGKAAELYRFPTVPTKRIFSLHLTNDIFVVQKYNPISDRWDLLCNVKMMRFEERKYFEPIFDGSKVYLIGGKKGPAYVPTVSDDAFCVFTFIKSCTYRFLYIWKGIQASIKINSLHSTTDLWGPLNLICYSKRFIFSKIGGHIRFRIFGTAKRRMYRKFTVVFSAHFAE